MAEVQVFYRVEHPDDAGRVRGPGWDVFRHGPYLGCELLMQAAIPNYNQRSADLNRELHKNPHNDEGLRYFWRGLSDKNPWYFGFSSMQALRTWFFDSDGRNRAVERCNARIGVYLVTPDDAIAGGGYCVGQFQTIVHYACARRVMDWPLNTWRAGISKRELALHSHQIINAQQAHAITGG